MAYLREGSERLKRVFVLVRLGLSPAAYARSVMRADILCRAVFAAGHAPFTQTFYDPQTPEEHLRAAMAADLFMRLCDELWIDAETEEACDRTMREKIKRAQHFPIPLRVVWHPEVFQRAAQPDDQAPIYCMHGSLAGTSCSHCQGVSGPEPVEAPVTTPCALCGAADRDACGHFVGAGAL